MRTSEYRIEQLDYYKDNAFPAIDSNDAREEVVVPQVSSDLEVKPAEDDTSRKEREEQMDAWMGDIKAFIRSIDVSKL